MNKALSQNKTLLRLSRKIAAKRKAKKNPHCVIMQSAPKDEAPAPAPEAPQDETPKGEAPAEEPDNTPVVTGEMEAAPSEGTGPEQPVEETATEPAAAEKPEPEQAPAPESEPEAEQELVKPRRKYRSKKKAAE